MVESDSEELVCSEVLCAMSDLHGVVVPSLSGTVVDAELEVDQDAVLMLSQEPYELALRFDSAVGGPQEPLVEIPGCPAVLPASPQFPEELLVDKTLA